MTAPPNPPQKQGDEPTVGSAVFDLRATTEEDAWAEVEELRQLHGSAMSPERAKACVWTVACVDAASTTAGTP